MTAIGARRRLIAGAAALTACVALALPLRAVASVRIYTMTWQGTESEAYTASDDTAFDTQRSGLQGCVYELNGNVFTSWRDEWRLVADVSNKKVSIRTIRLLSGPRWRGAISDSHVWGTISAPPEPADQRCASAHYAGTVDCRANPMIPHLIQKQPTFSEDRRIPDALDVRAAGFTFISATYRGTSPSAFGAGACATVWGTNVAPGGFAATDFGGVFTITNTIVRDEQLAGLRRGQAFSSQLRANSIYWDESGYPAPGESCALADSDESCHYVDSRSTDTARHGVLTFRRAG